MKFIPNTDSDRAEMLRLLGAKSVNELMNERLGDSVSSHSFSLPNPCSETEVLARLQTLASKNHETGRHVCFLGAGAYDHFVPAAVNEIVNRGEFKTSYTPYQSEVSQGVLQATYEYQSLICELTGMDISNASLYDGATAIVEASLMACNRTHRRKIAVSGAVHPEYRRVLKTYFDIMGIEILPVPFVPAGSSARPGESGQTDPDAARKLVDESVACLIVQNPNFFGIIEECEGKFAEIAHRSGAKYVVSADPISLGLLKPPGSYGADIVVGEGQSLGLQPAFGGATLGFMAIKNEGLERKERMLRFLPGRLVGATLDKDGRLAYALSLTNREQHVKREKATSNICTNQSLNAIAAAVYLCLLGKNGLRQVAELCLQKAHYACDCICKVTGFEPLFPGARFFKEFALRTGRKPAALNRMLLRNRIIGGYELGRDYRNMKNGWLLCVTEKRTRQEIETLAEALAHAR